MPAYRLTSRPALWGVETLVWTMIAVDYKQALARAQADDPVWNHGAEVELLPSTVGIVEGIVALHPAVIV